jgi:hypothetical protein
VEAVDNVASTVQPKSQVEVKKTEADTKHAKRIAKCITPNKIGLGWAPKSFTVEADGMKFGRDGYALSILISSRQKSSDNGPSYWANLWREDTVNAAKKNARQQAKMLNYPGIVTKINKAGVFSLRFTHVEDGVAHKGLLVQRGKKIVSAFSLENGTESANRAPTMKQLRKIVHSAYKVS